MSTLTSSPSSASSPRPQFSAHYSVSQRSTKSPRLLPFHSPTPRPHAPATAPVSATSPRYMRTPVSKPQTADAGTQYTPEGLPPTASQTAGSKRKDPFSPSPMNHQTTADHTLPQQPSESRPDLPAEPPADGGGSSATDLPSRPAPSQADSVDPTLSPSATKRQRTTTENPNVKMMPLKYETCNPKDLGYLISNMLMELIRLNDKLPLNGRLTRFHSR